MKQKAKVKLQLTMIAGTFDKWLVNTMPWKIATAHDFGGEYWQVDDEDDQKVIFLWPNDHLTNTQFFSMVSAMFAAGDAPYPGCGLSVYIDSADAKASAHIADRVGADITINDAGITGEKDK